MLRNLYRRLLKSWGFWLTDGAFVRVEQTDLSDRVEGVQRQVQAYAAQVEAYAERVEASAAKHVEAFAARAEALAAQHHELQKKHLDLLEKLGDEGRHRKNLEAIYFEDQLAEAQLQRHGPLFLAKNNTHIFSQTYEDSAVAEIFDRIGTTDRTFVEVGVEHGRENVTRLLLLLGWRGVWVEADPDHCDYIRNTFPKEIESKRLQLIEAFAEPDTIQDIIDSTGIGERIDLLSVDIDQHTSHVFRAIKTRARAACIEYNAHFPPTVEFETRYDPEISWDGTNIYGASLKTLEHIARDRGMALVGCDLMGVNAYFVDSELVGDRFLEPFIAETHYQPPRFSYIRGRRGHNLVYPPIGDL